MAVFINIQIPAWPDFLKQHHLELSIAATWTKHTRAPKALSLASHDQIEFGKYIGKFVPFDKQHLAPRRCRWF